MAIIGYVKTHHRRMLAREHWVRVPELTAGERSGLFTMEDALYSCHLRVGDPGPWAGPLSGIARLEMPSGIGRDAALDAADHAAGWLPGFASAAAHRDARAPVNLTPITGLERHLHPRQGDARLALRAVREAVLERNRGGGSAGRPGDGATALSASAHRAPDRGCARAGPMRFGVVRRAEDDVWIAPAAGQGRGLRPSRYGAARESRRPVAAPKLTQAALSDPNAVPSTLL